MVRPAGIEPAALRSGDGKSPLRVIKFEFAKCRWAPPLNRAYQPNCCTTACVALSH